MKVNFIITIENQNGKMYAYPYQTYDNYNLKSEFSKQKGLRTINYMTSWKKASELSNIWNKSFKEQNKLMTYDEYHDLQYS